MTERLIWSDLILLLLTYHKHCIILLYFIFSQTTLKYEISSSASISHVSQVLKLVICVHHHTLAWVQFSSVQSLSRVWLFAIPWTAAHQVSLSITSAWTRVKLMSITSVMPSNHLILCYPLLLSSIFPSIRVFSSGELALCIRLPKYWSFSFNISPSNEHPGLISFRMDWLDLLVFQGTLKSLLQHHSSKASVNPF